MDSWEGLTKEIEGVKEAARDGTLSGLAEYVSARVSRYCGVSRKETIQTLIRTALEAIKPSPKRYHVVFQPIDGQDIQRIRSISVPEGSGTPGVLVYVEGKGFELEPGWSVRLEAIPTD